MPSQLIDSHCHLDYEFEGYSTDALVQEARDKGVETLITIGTDRKSSEKVKTLSKKYSNVYHTIGVHPHDAIDMKDEDLDYFREASKDPKCVAIGEIGLDYHYDHSPREVQIKRVQDQLALAAELQLPVVIHSRDAEEELLKALTEYSKLQKMEGPIGVIHCFSGTREFGKSCIDLGFMISFSGIVTFKKSDDLRECAKAFPLDRILVETDSPYLAPVPFRGKQCRPSMVVETAKLIAHVRSTSFEVVAEQTLKNTQKLFRI